MTDISIPLVTIGIPTYNRADGYLRECIESALKQTYPNIEIVISDNCSTDGTDALIAGIGNPRIRYFRHSENIGANNNFNFCLKQSKGDYFLLLHDDDLIDPDFIEECMNAIGDNVDIGLIRTGTRLIDAGGQTIRQMPNNVSGPGIEDLLLSWYSHKTAFYLCSTLFHTGHLKAIGGFKSRHNLFQDVVAEIRLAATHGCLNVMAVKASFRKHEGEITFAVKVKDWCEDSLELLDIICKVVSEGESPIRLKGIRFFANLNFNRAMAVSAPAARLHALLSVVHHFGYRYPVLRRFANCLRISAGEFLFRKHRRDVHQPSVL